MSETPPAPDGSDPRVLTPDDDEPDVMIATQNTQAYHTVECRTIWQMRESGVGFRTVKQSVAEWRDLHECENCRREGEYDPDDQPDRSGRDDSTSVSASMCDAWRTYLGNGLDAVEVVNMVQFSESEVNRHLKGKCQHETDAPASSHGWHPADDPPDPTDPKGRRCLSPRTCYALRDRLLDGENLSDAADALDISTRVARNHAKGRCPHHNSTPPLERGWFPNE